MYSGDYIRWVCSAVEVQAVGVVAGHVAYVEGAVLGGAVAGLDDTVVQREAIHCLITQVATRMASEASRSFENVMYAEYVGPVCPGGLNGLSLFTTVFRIFPYCPKYSSFRRISFNSPLHLRKRSAVRVR